MSSNGTASTGSRGSVLCVVNAHREGLLLHRTLRSASLAAERARRAGFDVQTVVALDRADDITRAVALESRPDRTSLVDLDYGDLAEARNHAVAQATSDFVAFLDADDLWGPSWLADACMQLALSPDEFVVHPEFNIYFGGGQEAVFRHLPSTSPRFSMGALMRENHWTALSCARTATYRRFPYVKNSIVDGFGYEDWTWNVRTLRGGVEHRIAPQTTHFIRKGKREPSLLALTHARDAVPRIYPLYAKDRDVGAPSAAAATPTRRARLAVLAGRFGR